MLRVAAVPHWWLCWFSFISLVNAWSPEGHERIARICEPLLVGIQKDKVRSILKSDLIDISNWEETMTNEYPSCSALHFHKQEAPWSCQGGKPVGTDAGLIQCDGPGAEPESIICAFAYFWDQYVTQQKLRGFPRPETPIITPVIGGIDSIYNMPRDQLTPTNYMRWVSMFIGDMHQPMHWGFQYKYGQSISVYYDGDEHTLFSFWEEVIARNLSEVNGKWISLPDAEDVSADFTSRVEEWRKRAPVDLVRDWAQDVSQIMCAEVLGPLEENKADGSRTVKDRYKLQEDVVVHWIEVAKKLTKLAAERLAFLFIDILDHRKSARRKKKGLGKGKGKGKGLPSSTNASMASSTSSSSSSVQAKSSTTKEPPETSSHDWHPKDWVPPWRTEEYKQMESHPETNDKLYNVFERLAELDEEEEFPRGLPPPTLHTGLLV